LKTIQGLEALAPDGGTPPTLAQTVAQRLRELILDGTLPSGSPLRLQPLAEQLGISPMPVRDALRLLEAERLVVVRPRRGAVVAEMSLEDAEEIYTVRVALESLCARYAAERLTPSDVAQLEGLFGVMEDAQRSGSLSAFIEADNGFHRALYKRSNRPRLVEMIVDLTNRSRRYGYYLVRSWRVAGGDPLEAHRALLKAVRARDPDRIEEETRVHMQEAMGRLLHAIQQDVTSMRERAEPGDSRS
jgi:DNA-binding GntR family transcriptional regulator